MFHEIEDLKTVLSKEINNLEESLESIALHLHDKDVAIIRRIIEERRTLFTGLRIYNSYLNHMAEEYEKQHPDNETPLRLEHELSLRTPCVSTQGSSHDKNPYIMSKEGLFSIMQGLGLFY